MSATVIVTLQAKPGRGEELSAWLRALHPRLPSHAGFQTIALHRQVDDPDTIVEVERWLRADDHRAMVLALDADETWRELDALLVAAPQTVYLEPLSPAVATPLSAREALTGGCACGAIRFECTVRPSAVVNCYCRDCQRASGGACTTGAPVSVDAVTVHGAPKRHQVPAASGHVAWRDFCETCGTPLFAGTSARPKTMAIKVASFDEPRALAPTHEVWTASAPPWSPLRPELLSFPTQRTT